MRILSFEITDADGWTLEPMKLDAFNLLVGVSGAGKTRIVRAIERVCAVATGTNSLRIARARGARFAIAFEHDDSAYRWEAELLGNETSTEDEPLIQTERIERQGRTLVERTPEGFQFNDQPIPRLDRSTSAIAILREDPAMAPLYAAFSRCFFEETVALPMGATGHDTTFERQRLQYQTVRTLGADFSVRLHHKAEILHELFPDAFREVEEDFREAFPLVEKLLVQRVYRSDGGAGRSYAVFIAANEAGIHRTVPFAAMSAGMQRYLSFLIQLSFAPAGTVVLIDELESSFGINCLPAATRFLLRRAPDLQLILTSHHPYIIEQIPTACWRIVTRTGSHVRVLAAAAIPALEESRSHLDHFTRLINLPEYAQGIQAA